MEFIKDNILFVQNNKQYFLDGYIMCDPPLFAIVNSGKKWLLVHVPSEEVFASIFLRKKDAEKFLSIFWNLSIGKRILLTVPGVDLIRAEFAEEIRGTFFEYSKSWRI